MFSSPLFSINSKVDRTRAVTWKRQHYGSSKPTEIPNEARTLDSHVYSRFPDELAAVHLC